MDCSATRPSCPSPNPRAYSNSCPSSQWCHPTISSSVVPFSSQLQSFPASGSFQMSQVFASGGQIVGVSASAPVLPMNVQNWFPLGLTGWISMQSKGLSRVFSNNRGSRVGTNVRGWGWVVVVLVGLFFNKFLILRGFLVCWSNLYFLLNY